MEPITDEVKEILSRNKHNSYIIPVGDTLLADAVEASTDENWCLIYNQSICNALINEKYLSNIRDSSDGQYILVHCNAGVTYTNKFYSNPFWYTPKEIANIMSLLLVQKYHIITYKNKYGNEFLVHIPQQKTFNMTKAGLFYHVMIHLLKNKKNTHIMVNDSRHPIPKSGGKEETIHLP